MAFLRDRSVLCIPEKALHQTERYIIGGICMFTASLGFAGAALQLKSLRQFRNRQRRKPSANPDIIFYLALSDLIACTGVFALAICLMVFEVPSKSTHESNLYVPKHFNIYVSIGTIIEVITLFAYLASYLWTFAYALDMCFQIYGLECSMIVYHILSWAIPLELVVIIEVINFGLYPHECERGNAPLSRVILSYVPVIIVILVNPVLFIISYYKVRQQLRSSGSFTDVDRAALTTCRKKFLGMVIGFTICWLPNLVSVMHYISTFKKNHDEKSELSNMWYVEAFLNPLQGIFNYFLYRRAFRVTATDTRPEPGALPRVRVTPSLDTYRNVPPKNKTLQRITASTPSQDEDSPLLRQQASGPRYHYISRLLGE